MKANRRAALLATILLLGWAGRASANVAVIGDFETGDLSGWSVFTTTHGWLGNGYPDVVLFDTTGDSTLSFAAAFSVGQTVWQTGPQGGGIFQSVGLLSGDLTITADIAASNNIPHNNVQAGLFELLFDGVVVDSSDLGWIVPNSVGNDSLSATLSGVSADFHEVRFRMTRPFLTFTNPRQYIDNVVLSGSSVPPPIPEPSTFLLVLVGASGLAAFRLRRWRSGTDPIRTGRDGQGW